MKKKMKMKEICLFRNAFEFVEWFIFNIELNAKAYHISYLIRHQCLRSSHLIFYKILNTEQFITWFSIWIGLIWDLLYPLIILNCMHKIYFVCEGFFTFGNFHFIRQGCWALTTHKHTHTQGGMKGNVIK